MARYRAVYVVSNMEALVLEKLKALHHADALTITRAIYGTHKRKGEINAILYALERKGLVLRMQGTPPIWSLKV